MGTVPLALQGPAAAAAGTIFPELRLERRHFAHNYEGSWADYLKEQTPVEMHDGRWIKRDDYFAPLGYGGPNGTKLRQLIWLVDDYYRKGGRAGLLTAASVLSPQLSMGTLVARHYGLPTTIVLGATKPESALKHPNVMIAAAAGAEIRYISVGYNPALQAEVRRLKESEYLNHFVLKYGITNTYPTDERNVAWFHSIGAEQVHIPPNVKHLVMSAGSCNSATSVLWGIARRQPLELEHIWLFGIGPSKFEWMWERLGMIERFTGRKVRGMFNRDWVEENGPYTIHYVDLNATYAVYHDRKPYTLSGIELHPTYEGKIGSYLDENRESFPWWWDAQGDVMFWIVGSAPDPNVVLPYLHVA